MGERDRKAAPGGPRWPGAALCLVVDAGGVGERLDRWLARHPDIATRSRAKSLVDAGRVRVGGRRRKAGYLLRASETVEVSLPPAPPPGPRAEAIPLEVLHEDEALIALNKPPGMVVHPAPGARGGTVVNALLHRWAGIATVGDPLRPGIVHRLDRDTSGVLLVARTPAAHAALARQFSERRVTKAYLALVRGRVGKQAGAIDLPIGRHPRDRQRMSVRARRVRAAVTRYEVLERGPGVTLLRCYPETGRTHQVRVHLAAEGHPLVGDRRYGRPRAGAAKDPVAKLLVAFPRQALHAESIVVTHPLSGERLEIHAPLPPDLAELLAALRAAGLGGGALRGARGLT